MSQLSDGTVPFGEWLPDLPVTDNPGATEALNVLPVDGYYAPYRPIAGTGSALSERASGGVSVVDTAGAAFTYVGSATKLWQRSGSSWTDKSGVTYTTGANDFWRFAQFDELVIATNYADAPQVIEVGDGGNYGDLSADAPQARVIGIVGRHVVMGDTIYSGNTIPYRIQWSRINVGDEWPIPGSADALSKQAGSQLMPSDFGPVTGIVGNDQFGIVFQKSGVSRMSYVGGDRVYQFDVIDSTRGAICPNAIIKVGKVAYFIAADGFYATDGVTVNPIGAAKFDKYFLSSVDLGNKQRVYGALDRLQKLLYFSYPTTSASSGGPNHLLVHNYKDGKTTHAEDQADCLITGLTSATTLEELDALFASLELVTPPLDDPYWAGGGESLLAFDSASKIGTFTATPGVGVIDTAEVELNPGGRTYVGGLKPIVQGTTAVTASLGTRNGYGDSVSYTPDVAMTARTNVVDFRSDSRLHRARVKTTGNFTAAQGVQYQAQASGVA